MRDSAVVGLVGGGGIGFYLESALETDRWPTSFGLILIIIGFVVVVEQVGNQCRHRLQHSGGPGATASAPDSPSPPWTRARIAVRAGAAVLVVFIGYCCGQGRAHGAGAVAREIPGALGRVGGQLLALDLSADPGATREPARAHRSRSAWSAPRWGCCWRSRAACSRLRNIARARWVMHVTRSILVVVRPCRSWRWRWSSWPPSGRGRSPACHGVGRGGLRVRRQAPGRQPRVLEPPGSPRGDRLEPVPVACSRSAPPRSRSRPRHWSEAPVRPRHQHPDLDHPGHRRRRRGRLRAAAVDQHAALPRGRRLPARHLRAACTHWSWYVRVQRLLA